MFKRRQLCLGLILLLSMVLATAVFAQDDFGTTGVPYEVKESINGGENITITFWDWHDPRIPIWEAKAIEYNELYPNVTVEIVQWPWGDYWTKSAAAIPTGEGPDILHFHNSHHTQFVGNDLFEPFPESLFVPEYLSETWAGFAAQNYHNDAGELMYLPYGAMPAQLYINTAMWEAAGFTEDDIPTTWDELLVVAKELTVSDGQFLDIAGFGFNGFGELLWNDMQYQLGRYMYTADGTGCQVDNPEGRQAAETLKMFYDEGVNSGDFLGFIDGFATEKIAITYSFTFLSGILDTDYPDLEYFTIPMPTFTGEDLPARGRMNFEAGVTIPANNDEAHTEVAWDFTHWLFSDEDLLVDMALAMNIGPAYAPLAEHPRILENPTIADAGRVLEYKIFPGEFPGTMHSALVQFLGENIMAGASVDEAIEATQVACDQAMGELDYWTLEREYGHDDAMVPDQP